MRNSGWEKIDSYDKKQYWEEDRFRAVTWEFGSIYQCKVLIKYNHTIDGKKIISSNFNGEIGICLTPGKTREEACKRALDWIDTFQKRGILSSNKLFKKCQKNYPTIYPNRTSILARLFFTGGSGYDWLDGCLIETDPSSYLEVKAMRKQDQDIDDLMFRIKENRKEAHKLLGIPEPKEEEVDDEASYRKKCQDADLHQFYPVSKDYANICHVPDDVQTHWLKISYEAAILLRDKSGIPDIKSKHHKPTERDVAQQIRNSKIGADVVLELERRFPHVLKKVQQISTEEA